MKMSMPSRPPAIRSVALAVMPGLFVFLWSTGFIGAKLGLPYAPPLTFLTLRFFLVLALLLPVALLTRAPWPRSAAEIGHYAVAGLLLHVGYLGGVYIAIGLGVEAGLSALIVSIQPLLVAALAGLLLGERVSRRAWIGLALGLAGVGLVVQGKLGAGIGDVAGIAACLVALAAITGGTIYQKRFCAGMDLRTGNLFQFLAAAVVAGLAALLFEDLEVQWTGEFVFALGWLVLVLSLGAFSLLYLLIRRGAANRVASLFFLVPPCTALIAWPLFGETLGPVELAGMALVVVGVALVNLPGGALRR
ncbi:DMT family transporter [Rhodospirillales bacterium YIM 152171]|uniref:DMT family transporter n=2 Tax=Marinimicrococcus flavescens TaxID=3031815 RepID=A0AAP3UXB6_9PROT|nr:DMT family transporter [Marinimicrococcus flavescens]